MNLENLRKKSTLSVLQSKVEEIEKSNKVENERQDDGEFWKLTMGEDGTGSAIIRFLPATDGEDVPYVSYFEHYFKNENTNRWYRNKSRTTLGKNEKDPVGEYNRILWKQGEEGQELARKMKRKEKIIANILVVKDFANPENDGKVFKFSYGKKIHEKIMNAMKGDEEIGEEGFNPFCPWEGANFSLKVKRVKEFPNYDDSKFLKQTSIGNDDTILSVCKQTYPLLTYIDPETFKSYEKLEEEFNEVMGFDGKDTKSNKSTVAKSNKNDNPSFDEDITSLTSTSESDIDDLLKDIDLDSI